MKNQAFIFSKDKSKKLKCRPLQFLFGVLRVKCTLMPIGYTFVSLAYFSGTVKLCSILSNLMLCFICG